MYDNHYIMTFRFIYICNSHLYLEFKILIYTFVKLMFRIMTDINDRLEQFLAAENLSQSQFADTINVARASVSHIIAGRNKPGWDFLNNTLSHYPSLNIEWLLTGKGRMYKSSQKTSEEDEAKEASQASPVNLFSAPEQKDPASATASSQNQVSNSPANSVDSQPVQTVGQTLSSEGAASASLQHQSGSSTPTSARRITKILVFYDDNTFSEIG